MSDNGNDIWKNCTLDALKSLGGGLFVGGVVSILTLHSWPFIFGIGVGLGVAYDKCEGHYNKRMQKMRSNEIAEA